MKYLVSLLLCVALGCAGASASSPSVEERALDWTVLVQTPEGRTFCSATVVKRTRLLLSAWHCFADGKDFQLNNNKDVFHAVIVAVDLLNDIVVLRPFDYQYKKRDGVKLARKAPRIGDDLFSVGHAYGDGFPFTLTAGVVSYPRRTDDDPQTFLQSTVPLMDGMSGGGTYDARGHLVGVNLFHRLEPVRCTFVCGGVYSRAPVTGHAHLFEVRHLLSQATK